MKRFNFHKVLSKNARQNPDEIADKVSKYDEEDDEMVCV